MTRVRRLLDGTGPYSGIGLGFFALAPLLLLSILLTPHGWQWWLDANTVPGHEEQGIVSYSYAGQSWTVDDTGSSNRAGPRTVYVIAADPGHGALSNTSTMALDWAITTGPVLVGVGFLAIGFRRRTAVRKRSAEASPSSFGAGIPSELIRNITQTRDLE